MDNQIQPTQEYCKNDRWFKPAAIIIGILIVIGLFGNIYLLLQKQKSLGQPKILPTPTTTQVIVNPTSAVPTLATDETANWKIYQDIKYKFSFSYPPEYTIKQNRTGDSIQLQSSFVIKGETGGITELEARQKHDYFNLELIISKNIPKISEIEYVKKQGEDSKLFSNYQNGEIKGIAGIMYNAWQEQPTRTIIFLNGDNLFVFKLWGEETGNYPSEEARKKLDQILSTFRFD